MFKVMAGRFVVWKGRMTRERGVVFRHSSPDTAAGNAGDMSLYLPFMVADRIKVSYKVCCEMWHVPFRRYMCNR